MSKRSPKSEKMQKYVSHPLQGLAAHFFFWFFRMLPVDMASGLGGRIARLIGPKLGQTKKARKNLARAFPEKTPAEIEIILGDMWENLGRSVGEIPHLHKFVPGGPRIELAGLEHATAFKHDGKPGLIFTGHMGNWEIGMLLAVAMDLDMMCVYRAPDNPWVDRLFLRARRGFRGQMVPKGSKGARLLTKFLKEGGHAAMLVDQKMNDGIAVPFFGRDAMTAPALAQFVLRYDCPLVPMRVERLGGAYFRMNFYPALEIETTENRNDDILKIMTDVNHILEGWIRERPAQWLWLHRRWPD